MTGSGEDSEGAMRDLKWSAAEKAVARKAFERALQRELGTVVREAKEMAAKIQEPAELWELERYLNEQRREIDQRYDYRYSVLPSVFGELIRRGCLREEELDGLGADKFNTIRRYARR